MYVRSSLSSYRDRTNEFLSVAEGLKKLVPNSADNVRNNSGSKAQSKNQSEFNKRSSKIGLGIHQTLQNLSKLTKLAKRTSVFDDPMVEIQELTAVIKQDITALNAAVVELQLHCNSQNEDGSDTTSHSTTVVDNLKNRLMSATKEFKEVLTKRTENMKVHESRRQLFSSTSKETTNPFLRQRPLASRYISNSSETPPPWSNQSASSKHPDRGESQPLIQQQQQEVIQVQDNYMQSRNGTLQNIESTIHELGNIFTHLATMVSQQGELTIRIDESMEDTLSNVEGAQGQLVRYFNNISSNRWLMIKIFFILIVFLMIFLFLVA